MKKIKKNYEKIITYVKQKENYGKVLLGILIIIFLVFTAIYILGTRNISKIEEEKIKEESKKYIDILEDITESKSNKLDKYIIFVLDYSINNEGKNTITSKQVAKQINKIFDKKVTKEEVVSIGITEEMLSKNITYDSGEDKYSINIDERTGREIEKEKLIYYKEEKIRRKNKNTYVIRYIRYEIENPYDILNYYIDKNNEVGEKEQVDITPIKNYLLGSTTRKGIKEAIEKNEEDIKEYAKRKGTTKIIYRLEKNKLIIEKIK